MPTRLGFLTTTVAVCAVAVSVFGQPARRPPTPPIKGTATSTIPAIETPAASNIPAKVTFLNRTSVSATITSFRSSGIEITFPFSDDNVSAAVRKTYAYADITRIDLVTPDAALQKQIVNVALSVGNAVLAYNTACSVQNDPDMKALSENQDFPKAIADVNTTQSAYAALAKKVELLRQQSERSAVYANAHRKELAQMMSERDAAKNAGEGAQAALTGLCQQTLNAIQSVKYLGQYEAYLNGAKDSIAEKDIGSAIEKLQAAVVLPDCVKKNEALSLLKDAQTAQSSPQELLQGMSDTDFQSLCSTGTMPSSQKLSYDPLNAIYLQKLLAAKDSEASRRKAIQEEAERKAKATREEAQRKAEAKQKEQASQEESVRRAIAGDAAEPQLEGNDLLAWKLAYGQVIGDWYSGAFPSRPIRRLMTKNDNGSYVFLFSNLNEWVNNPYPNLSYAPHTMWEVIVMNYGKTLGVVRSSMKFLSPNQSMDEFNKLYSELFGPYIQTAPMSATANVPVKAAPKP